MQLLRTYQDRLLTMHKDRQDVEDAKTSAVATAEALQSEVEELRRRIGGVGLQDDTEAAEAAEEAGAAGAVGAAGAAGAKPAGRPAASSPIYRKGVTSIPPTPTPFGAVAAARGEEKVTARGEMNRGGAETKRMFESECFFKAYSSANGIQC